MSLFIDNFTPQNFLDLSSLIFNSVSLNNDIPINSRDSAWLRSAISRAYYAAFLTLREEFLQDQNLRSLIIGRTRDHQTIKTRLQNLPIQLFYLAGFFEDLRSDRNSADYKIPPDFHVSPEKVSLSIAKAHEIITNRRNIITNI